MNQFEAKDIEIGGKVYAVTMDGGIFMHSYTDRAGKIRKNKWIKPSLFRGRYGANLKGIDGDTIHKSVHQMVMMAWGSPAPEGMENPTIDHIDENCQNNHIDNLQWMEHVDNVKKSMNAGRGGWAAYHKSKAQD